LCIVVEKIKHFKVDLFGRFELQHAIRGAKLANLFAEFFGKSFLYDLVGK
jgi:hypothetical protein